MEHISFMFGANTRAMGRFTRLSVRCFLNLGTYMAVPIHAVGWHSVKRKGQIFPGINKSSYATSNIQYDNPSTKGRKTQEILFYQGGYPGTATCSSQIPSMEPCIVHQLAALKKFPFPSLPSRSAPFPPFPSLPHPFPRVLYTSQPLKKNNSPIFPGINTISYANASYYLPNVFLQDVTCWERRKFYIQGFAK